MSTIQPSPADGRPDLEVGYVFKKAGSVFVDDIVPLARHFLAFYGGFHGPRLSADAEAVLHNEEHLVIDTEAPPPRPGMPPPPTANLPHRDRPASPQSPSSPPRKPRRIRIIVTAIWESAPESFQQTIGITKLDRSHPAGICRHLCCRYHADPRAGL
jgi:hypothetical protein